MIFNNKGTKVNVDLNLGKTPSKVRNELIINGYVLDATTEEDHKRAMLHAVFDALDMDIEEELRIYRMTQKRENRHAGDVPISL